MEGSTGYLSPLAASLIDGPSDHISYTSSFRRLRDTVHSMPASGSSGYSSSRLSTRCSQSTSALTARSGEMSDYSSYHTPTRASSCGYSSDEHNDSDDADDVLITGTKVWLHLKDSNESNDDSSPNESSGWQGPKFDSSGDVISTPSWLMLRQRLQALHQDSYSTGPFTASASSANATGISNASLEQSSGAEASTSKRPSALTGDSAASGYSSWIGHRLSSADGGGLRMRATRTVKTLLQHMQNKWSPRR